MACCDVNQLDINAGSDLSFSFKWVNPDQTPMDLTGYAAGFYGAPKIFTDNAQILISDAVNGVVSVVLQWHEDMKQSRTMRAACKLTLGAVDTTSPVITVHIHG